MHTGEVIKAGELEIRPSEYLVLARGRALTLSLKELELLAALARREGAADEVDDRLGESRVILARLGVVRTPALSLDTV